MAKKKEATDSHSSDPQELLDVILRNTGGRASVLDEALDSRIDRIRELMPKSFKMHAERAVERAKFYFKRCESLQDCSVPSLVKCVLEAAELGLFLDGQLCHASPFNNNKGTREAPHWVKEAQCIPDYKGLLSIARRNGVIKFCHADVVRKRDQYAAYVKDGKCCLEHRPSLVGDREVIGAYARFVLADGSVEFCHMDAEELDNYRAFSKAKHGPWHGPWNEEMMKKCPIRRGLKMFRDDPDLARAMDFADDAEALNLAIKETAPPRQPAASLTALQQKLESELAGEPEAASDDEGEVVDEAGEVHQKSFAMQGEGNYAG